MEGQLVQSTDRVCSATAAEIRAGVTVITYCLPVVAFSPGVNLMKMRRDDQLYQDL